MMFNLAPIIQQLDRAYPSLIALRHAEKTELLTNQPDEHRSITPAGQTASKTLAVWLLEHGFIIDTIKTSPVKRCLQTAQCLQTAMPSASITTCSLLGDPGAYVADAQLAATLFAKHSVRAITHFLWQETLLAGMHSLKTGTQQLLTTIYQDLTQHSGQLIYISHDAIWVPFITAITQQLLPNDYWLDYLQGFAIQRRKAYHLTIILANYQIELALPQGV